MPVVRFFCLPNLVLMVESLLLTDGIPAQASRHGGLAEGPSYTHDDLSYRGWLNYMS